VGRVLEKACASIEVRTLGPSAITRPDELLLPFPELVPGYVDGPAGSAEEIEKVP
jgi:hypothetical protein